MSRVVVVGAGSSAQALAAMLIAKLDNHAHVILMADAADHGRILAMQEDPIDLDPMSLIDLAPMIPIESQSLRTMQFTVNRFRFDDMDLLVDPTDQYVKGHRQPWYRRQANGRPMRY